MNFKAYTEERLKDFHIWRDENIDAVMSLYPLVGEYVMCYSRLQEQVEDDVADFLYHIFPPRSTKFSGFPFGRLQNGEFLILVNFLDRLVERSPWIYTKAEELRAKKEIKRLHAELKIIHELRNILAHGFWSDWTREYPSVSISTNKNSFGRRFFTVDEQCIKDWTLSISLLSLDFSSFIQKYRFGEGIEKPSRKTAWYKTKIEKTSNEYEGRKRLLKLKNIGMKAELFLTMVGLYSPEKLREAGYEKAYQMILDEGCPVTEQLKLSLRGALEDKDWKEYSKKRLVKNNI